MRQHANCGCHSRRAVDYNTRVTIQLRDFCRDDLNTLWSIDVQCFPPGIAYTPAELAAFIGGWKAFTLVAEVGSPEADSAEQPVRVAGFLVAQYGRRKAGHIITIDVLAQFRRGGVGSRLLNAAEERLIASDCNTVFLETAVDNAAALAFYKRNRYDVIRTIPRYYASGVDALVLEKDLQPVHTKDLLSSPRAS